MKSKFVLFLFLGFSFMSCITIDINFNNSWSEPAVTAVSGTVEVKSEEEFSFEYGNAHYIIVKGKITNGDKIIPVNILLDTGTEGNFIDYSVSKQFNNLKESQFEFFAMGGFSHNAIDGVACFFDELEFGTATFKDILIQQGNVSVSGITTNDGQPVNVILGMDAIKKHAIYISPSRKRISFPSKMDKEKFSDVIELKDKNLKHNRLYLPMSFPNTKIKENLYIVDIGCDTSVILRKDFEKLLKNKSVFGFSEKCGTTYKYALFEGAEFLGNQIDFLPSFKGSFGNKHGTIGYSVLSNFDMFIDVKNKIAAFTYIKNNDISTNLKEINWVRFGVLKDYFGFSLNEVNGVRHVDGVFIYNNGKAMLPEVKYGDELISIDGIPQFVYPWTKWNNLQEADFVFKRGKKEFTVHAKRKSLYLENEE